jgi:hypothetical protein
MPPDSLQGLAIRKALAFTLGMDIADVTLAVAFAMGGREAPRWLGPQWSGLLGVVFVVLGFGPLEDCKAQVAALCHVLLPLLCASTA